MPTILAQIYAGTHVCRPDKFRTIEFRRIVHTKAVIELHARRMPSECRSHSYHPAAIPTRNPVYSTLRCAIGTEKLRNRIVPQSFLRPFTLLRRRGVDHMPLSAGTVHHDPNMRITRTAVERRDNSSLNPRPAPEYQIARPDLNLNISRQRPRISRLHTAYHNDQRAAQQQYAVYYTRFQASPHVAKSHIAMNRPPHKANYPLTEYKTTGAAYADTPVNTNYYITYF